MSPHGLQYDFQCCQVLKSRNKISDQTVLMKTRPLPQKPGRSVMFEVFCDVKLRRWVMASDTWQDSVPSPSRSKQSKTVKREGNAIIRNVGNHDKRHSLEELNPQ
jgi:hypothetical protein